MSKTHLTEIFRLVLQYDDRPCLLFLDGIDEYHGQKPELVKLIKDIAKLKVKVCVSSRNENPFSSFFGSLTSKLLMEEVNKPGINSYARDVLPNCWDASTAKENRVLMLAAQTIASNAHGVFLWARFAVSDVVKMLEVERRVKHDWIEDIITKMPQDLEQIYHRIFSSMDTRQRHSSGIQLQLVDAAQHPLHLDEILEAALLAGVPFRSMSDCLGVEDLDGFRQYLRQITNGILEISASNEMFNRGHTVRMVHRTVQTYLDKIGWQDLFSEQSSPGCRHALWITVCKRFFAGESVNWDSSDYTFRKMINEHRGRPQRDIAPYVQGKPAAPSEAALVRSSIDTGDAVENFLAALSEVAERQPPARFSLSTYGLEKYAQGTLLAHGRCYELETHVSSWMLLHNVMTSDWVEKHVNNIKDGTRGLWSNILSDTGRSCLFGGDVQLAILYHLQLYVENALQRSPELATSYTGSFFDSLIDVEDNRRVSTRNERARLLATAVFCSWAAFGSSTYCPTIELLVPISPCLNDSDLLMAIAALPAKEVEALLTQRPLGCLKLRSKILISHGGSDIVSFRVDRRHALLPSEFTFGPLWAIGARQRPDGMGNTEKILRLFLARGEDINRKCGPHGTILHSMLLHWLHFGWGDRYKYFEPAFRICVRYCANMHIKGLHGNALELFRMGLHSKDISRHTFDGSTQPIELFISMGIQNPVCDPSGSVPSMERMLTVARKGKIEPEDMSLYYYGNAARAGEWIRYSKGKCLWAHREGGSETASLRHEGSEDDASRHCS